MKKITLLALIAGAIISLEGSATAQGIYLDFGNNPGPRYRDYDDGPRYRDRERFRGERYGDRRDRGDRGYYRPGGTRPLTAAKTAGQCKTASASRTGGTEQKFVANGGLSTMATTQIEKIEKALQAIKADAVQHDSSERKRADEAREQAERSFRPTDKEAWLRIAQEWMKLAQTRDEPVVGVIGALSLIHAVK